MIKEKFKGSINLTHKIYQDSHNQNTWDGTPKDENTS